MTSAPQLLHRHIGSPKLVDCDIDGVASCWICGSGYESGIDSRKWLSSAMTDQNQCRDPDAEFVCTACVYFRSRSSEVPGRMPGPCSKCKGVKADVCEKCEGTGKNSTGGNYRNYSHLFDAGRPVYISASKGEKPEILSFLRGPKIGPWFAAIADSGQKHVLPYAPLNASGRGGVVLFEETLVPIPASSAKWALSDDMCALLTGGATKGEIETCSYQPGAWTRCEPEIKRFEQRWRSSRGSSFFSLCLWLSQRDEEQVQMRLRAEKETAKARSESKRKPKGKPGATEK